jgi:N-dimethylarginine dimethylaminohydrolase
MGNEKMTDKQEGEKYWWGQLRGVKGEKPWWKKKYEYKPDWWKNVPGYEPGKPIVPGRLLNVSFLDELEIVRGRKWGAQGEIGKLKSVLVSRPTENEVSREKSEAPELFFAYDTKGGLIGDLAKMQDQHDRFVEVLKGEGVEEVIELDVPSELPGPYVRPVWLTTTRSPVIIKGGAILERFSHTPVGKAAEVLWQNVLTELGIPILYTIHGYGSLTGGNWVWLDSEHVCIGESIASDIDGINQVSFVLKNVGVDEIHIVYLQGSSVNPTYPARGAVHLDGRFGIADKGLGVYYGLPFYTIAYLQRKGINLIEVPPEEQRNYATNIIAIEPGRVIIPAGNPKTTSALRKEGVDVTEVDVSEFAKGTAGPHCLTFPLIRETDPSIKDLEGRKTLIKYAG